AVESLTFMQSLLDGEIAAAQNDYGSAVAEFATGKSGMLFTGVWELRTMQNAGIPFDATMIPTIYGTPAVYADSHSFVLPHQASADERRRDLTYQFVADMLKGSFGWAEAAHIPAYLPVTSSPEYAIIPTTTSPKESNVPRPHHHRPRLHDRRRPPTPVRVVRRAHGALRLHRHLRAGASAGRRARLPQGRARAGARDGSHCRALPRRQLRVGVPLGGRRRSGGGSPGAHRRRLAHHRDQRVRPARVRGLGPRGGGRGDGGDQPGHPRRRGGAGAGRIRQPSRRHALVGPAAIERSGRPVRHQAVVPGQRAG